VGEGVIRIKNKKKEYYFSNKLKKQLAQISNYPVTVVEAPSGFGKTTAVSEYLNENLPQGACEHWYTCLGESAEVSWKGICELLAYVDKEAALNLEQMDMPARDTLFYLMTFLKNLKCQMETFLIIDNYHLLNCEIPRELMNIFSFHGNSNLHIIFITQQLRQELMIHNTKIHSIHTEFFKIEREGILYLFRMKGIYLSDYELECVYVFTEGWVSAICLQVLNYEEKRSLDYTTDIERLVEVAIWSRLTPEERQFLLSVSVLDNFTPFQAAVMIEKKVLPDNIEKFLKSCDFIRYIPENNNYTVHNILKDYLRKRFYNYWQKDYQNKVFNLAGQSYAGMSHYYTAAGFFFRAGNFDAILSLPLRVEEFCNHKEQDFQEFIVRVTQECPEETFCKYPFTMLTFAYVMLFENKIDVFERLSGLIVRVIERNDLNLNDEEQKKLKGEHRFLESFAKYNNIKAMDVENRKTLEILGEPSDIIVNKMPWTFGSTSILSMFWSEPGKLDCAVKDMEECLPCYLKLTRGHGYGADSAFQAEVLLMRGEDEQAEILCYKALYEARSHRQVAICLCVEVVLARIAILRGDADFYFTTIRNIKNYAKGKCELYVVRMVDLALTVISLVLGMDDHVAKWFFDIEKMKKTLFWPALPYAQILYAHLLIFEGRYQEFYGVIRYFIGSTENSKFILSRVYYLIFLSVAKWREGNVLEARKYLKEAFDLALPDKIYLPFAQQDCMKDFLLKAIESFEPVEVIAKKRALSEIKTLCRRQTKGVNIIKKTLLKNKSPLTSREREVAMLAKERYSAKFIANKLFISEATVRTILKSIYSKLDIHSKAELNSIDF
jgi:LuxR family maltose regulon positive regulatory protein